MSKSEHLKTNPFERSQLITRDFFDIPLLGQVRSVSLSHSSGDYHLSELVSNFQNTDRDFITIEVLDNAMSKTGILRGDFLTIDLKSKPKNNDIIVVKLGERFFIRRFYLQNRLIRLETADRYPSSFVIEEKTPGFQIIGKASSLSRQF